MGACDEWVALLQEVIWETDSFYTVALSLLTSGFQFHCVHLMKPQEEGLSNRPCV